MAQHALSAGHQDALALGSLADPSFACDEVQRAQQREVCDLLRNRLTRTRQVFFTPATVEGVCLEGQDDEFTLVVALTQKDRPQIHYKLAQGARDGDFAEAGLPDTTVDGWAVWLQEAIAEAVDAAPGLPIPNGHGTVVVDLDRRR